VAVETGNSAGASAFDNVEVTAEVIVDPTAGRPQSPAKESSAVSDEPGISSGAIIGIVCAVVAVLAVVLAIVVYRRKQEATPKNARRVQDSSTVDDDHEAIVTNPATRASANQ